MTDNKKLWENTLAQIELSLSKANFTTWFRDTFILRQEEGIVYLGVPNTFVKDWLINKYHSDILKTMRDISPDVRGVEYTIAKEDARKKEEDRQQNTPQSTTNRELPLTDYINKDDNLNPRYTFDSFVIGPFNELAHAAAQAVIRQPGIVYNPLFIYGNTGHGKTHLIQGIGNYIKKHGDKRIFYTTSEKFTSDIVNSLQTNKIAQLKDKYRKYDVLIMDDIQFLSGKEKTQEELFHLFNTLYDNNKQIVFSSDKHPNFIPGLEDRLKSRFNQGMIVDIPKPDHESRMAILNAKAKINNITIAHEVVDYLATTIEGNIRELEGVLNMIICQTQLKGKELNINDIRSLIKNSAKPKKNISVKELIKIVSEFYNIDEETILNKTRKKEVVRPRQIIMYILREDFNISYPTIGEKLGGRDHTTVIHSCEKVKNDLKFDNTLAQELNQIRSIF